MGDRHGLFEELKRRHVWRVAVAYVVAAWLLVQVATQVFPFFHIPDWSVRLVVVLLALGFPVVMVLAWVFEITSEGVRRTAPVDSPEARAEPTHHDVGRKLNVVIVVVLVLAIAMLGWRLYAVRHALPAAVPPAVAARVAPPPTAAPTTKVAAAAATTAQPIPAKSIAVLPFENLSSDKNNAYFADGIQDLILTKLADIGDLKVISRTSTMQYGSHPQNLKTVGDQLGVATILEGSVQKQGNQVLINVQLIKTSSDSHLWAQSYTRTLDNVFGVEGEVAEKIATALNTKLSPTETATLAAAPTHNKAAYDAFLRAEYQSNNGWINYDTASMKAAIPLYRQAVEHDPNFALAWARLSYQESVLAWFGGGGEDLKKLVRQARADAGRALKLAPDKAASQIALGYCDYYGTGDYVGALKAFAAALKLQPNDVDALAAQGYVHRRQGHFEAAIASLHQAFALDPRNSALASELGETYQFTSRYADAENWYQRALALDPHNLNAKGGYSYAILLGSGDVARALRVASGDAPSMKQTRTSLLIDQRKYRDALALLESVPDTPDNFAVASGSKALAQANLYRLMHETAKARPLYRHALAQAKKQVAMQKGIQQAFAWQSVANAELGLGETRAGLQAIARSLAFMDKGSDYEYGSELMEYGAYLYALAGRPDLAVPLLARALAMPGSGVLYSPVMLWLDPAWDPIRHDPRFQALLKKYAKFKPAVIYLAPSGTAPH